MTLLLATLTLTRQQPSDDEALRLDAVNTVVAFAREIEAACRPHYKTSPPTPFPAVPNLAPSARRAVAITNPGVGYAIDYPGLYGSVTPGQHYVAFGRRGGAPEGARRWTQEERIESARKVARILIPEDYTLGESKVHDVVNTVMTDVVLKADPRLRANRIDLSIDPWTGTPEIVRKWLRYPEVNRDRLINILPEEPLAAEALRVHQNLPPFPPARLGVRQLVYYVPHFRKIVNELTPTHHGNIERGEAIPIYMWCIGHSRPRQENVRTVYVDARTGRGIAANDLTHDFLGGGKPLPAVAAPDAGRWRSGKEEGTFVKAEAKEFEGIPVVIANAKDEVLTLRFDRKTGLARDESGTYRPDAALLKALRAEKPPRPFGKKG